MSSFFKRFGCCSTNRRTGLLLTLLGVHALLSGAASGPIGDWGMLTPERLKTPVVVELTRNPCQPAVPGSTRLLRPAGKEKDDIATALQALLTNRVRSVVRSGSQPVVLLGARLVRPGDEIVFETEGGGGGAVAGLPAALRLRLKEVRGDRILWMAETPGDGTREIVCWLDLFLRGP